MDSVGCVVHAELVPRQARRSARGACDEAIVARACVRGLAETCEFVVSCSRGRIPQHLPATTSTTTMSSPFIKARGWERFVVYDATGAFSLSPSAKNMPPCDARGRAVTAPGRSRGSLSDEESPEKKGSKARGDGASERDRVTIEYCTVERPTMTLRGSAEEYERHALTLQAYLQEKFPKLRVDLQRPPASLTRAKDKGISHAHDAIYVPASWSEPRMPSPAEGRRRFPRVNAFEVKLNGRLIFSKLAGGPAADFPKMHDDEYVEIGDQLEKLFARRARPGSRQPHPSDSPALPRAVRFPQPGTHPYRAFSTPACTDQRSRG